MLEYDTCYWKVYWKGLTNVILLENIWTCARSESHTIIPTELDLPNSHDFTVVANYVPHYIIPHCTSTVLDGERVLDTMTHVMRETHLLMTSPVSVIQISMDLNRRNQ